MGVGQAKIARPGVYKGEMNEKRCCGGDLRSIGRADEVVLDILNNPQHFHQVFTGVMNDEPLIRMRSADAVEKVLRVHPEKY